MCAGTPAGDDGMWLSWRRKPCVPHIFQRCVIVPPAKRWMVISVHVVCLPVEAIPIHAPWRS